MVVVAERLFKAGDIIVNAGMYLCVPCGYMQYFKAGETLPVCPVCLAGTSEGPISYNDANREFWVKV